MRALSDYISTKIIGCIDRSGDKTLIRIEGFEDLSLYHRVSRRVAEYCAGSRRLIIRLSLRRYEQMKDSRPFEAQDMLSRGWIDTGDHMTSYRNIVPSPGERLVVLLLGTDMVSDKGGLNDFYAITPQRIDREIKKDAVGRLIDDDCLQEAFDGDERVRKVFDAFFGELFRFVPYDLSRVSAILDGYRDTKPDVEAVIADLFERLPEWGLPRITDRAAALSPSKLDGGKARAMKTLETAAKFMRGKLYAKVSPTVLKNLNKKFDSYIAAGKKYALEYPEGQAIPSLEALRACALSYISGSGNAALRQKLLHTDFSILDDVLAVRSIRIPSERVPVFTGMPLTAFIEMLLCAMRDFSEDGVSGYATLRFRLTQARLCGIPSAIEAGDGAERRQLLTDAFRRIALFTGGVFDFIGIEAWEAEDGTLFGISCEPADCFAPEAAEQLVNETGIVSACTGQCHKLSFSIEALSEDGTCLTGFDTLWQIDPYEDWMTAFALLARLDTDEKAFLPYVRLSRINTAFSLKDEDSFAYFIDHEDADFPTDNSSILKVLAGLAGHAEETRAEFGRFYELGMKFMAFKQRLFEKGFYACMDEIAALSNAYIELAQRIATEPVYSGKLRIAVRCFTNAFAIFENDSPITKDIFVKRAILPPFHPATLEKMADRMIFLRSGLHEYTADGARGALAGRVEQLLSLSRIHNATDALMESASHVLPCERSFGYFTLYGTARTADGFVSAQEVMQKELVFDDDFEDRELKRMTREAGVIYDVLARYSKTYPQCRDNLSLVFINPGDLQYVVSALQKYIGEDRVASVRLTVITHRDMHGARAYLAYWIDSIFAEDTRVSVKAYLRKYDALKEIPKLLPRPVDIIFFMDALGTDRNADYAFRARKGLDTTLMTECRFPMVFKPAVTASNATEHTVDITQPQFAAATAHTQVLRAYKDAEMSARAYELVQSSQLSSDRGEIIRSLQKSATWLCAIDAALDKHTVRDLYTGDTGIIGYATGRGSFGQLNLAITCRNEAKDDMIERCRRRLKRMFPSWADEKLNAAAVFCFEKAKELDGASLLAAMNTDDYEINNYLAYLIASELYPAADGQLNVLIRLDSYRHWFAYEKQDEKKIPDFMLLQADINEGEDLRFHATVLEAKIARADNMGEHLGKARMQLEQGIEVLSRHFDPNNHVVEHRYWLSQLYRAIAFLQTDMHLDAPTFLNLTEKLRRMMENHYSIDWKGRVLACELDASSYIDDGYLEGGEYECRRIGQLALQNILLKEAIGTGTSFDGETGVETAIGDEGIETRNLNSTPAARRPAPAFVPPAPRPQPTATLPPKPETAPSTPAAPKPVPPAPVPPMPPQAQPEAPTQPSPDALLPIEAIRVPVGRDRAGRDVCWEFGHPQLSNRHLLITGGSGQGKTYAIQTFLYELSRQNISSVVFDYTDGFLPGKLEPPFEAALGEKITQHIVVFDKLPINPFKRQLQTVGTLSRQEPSTMAAGRFASIMKHVYSFGEQQYSALYRACKDGIDRYGDKMDFDRLRRLLEADDSNYAKTVLSKMLQLFDLDRFDTENAFDWSAITEREGRVTVIQLTGLDRSIQTVITEMLMWDAWYALTKCGDKSRPFVVVLDEAQNLSIADGSPAQKILQEGRKYGWSAWFATQFLKGALTTDEISRLQQAAVTMYFKPSSEETNYIAGQLADAGRAANDWAETLKQMQKGSCIVRGDRIRPNGSFGACPATLTQVMSFEDRT